MRLYPVLYSSQRGQTDSLMRRLLLYEVLGGFQRKEAVSKLELSEECLAVGVNSVTDNSYRNRQRFIHGLKKLCLSFESMSTRSYTDAVIHFLNQGLNFAPIRTEPLIMFYISLFVSMKI